MKKLIVLTVIGLVGCGTGNPFAGKLKDYQGSDASVLQVKNYLDTSISFYEKDASKNCLVKKETKILNNSGPFSSNKYRMNYESPFSYLGKSVIEYNLKPNQYAELLIKPDRNWITDSLKFRIGANKYYLLDVKSNNDQYVYRLITVPAGKERAFASLGNEYNAKPWDLDICK